MKELTKNAINMLGQQGSAWIEALPATIELLSAQWELSDITQLSNMTYHYVAKATRSDGQPVILKIGFDRKAILNEKQALTYFNGHAAVRLFDYDEKYNALLLDQAIPGTTLKSFYPARDAYVIDCYVDTVKRLHSQSMHHTGQFRHIEDWLKSLDTVESTQLPEHLLKRAIHLKTTLLSTMANEVVLHGDMHHDNILQHNDAWIVIDPKGIIGEPEFEIAAFDFISPAEIKPNHEVRKLFDRRVNLIAEKSHLDANRIRDWVFVRLMLSAAWHIEDKGDPSWAIHLAELII